MLCSKDKLLFGLGKLSIKNDLDSENKEKLSFERRGDDKHSSVNQHEIQMEWGGSWGNCSISTCQNI